MYKRLLVGLMLCFILLTSSAVIPQFKPHQRNNNQLFNKQVQSVLKHAYTKYKLPALSVSIHLPGEPFIRNYTVGTYTLAKKRPITPNTLFQIGSITKTYFAVVIMKLVETGMLSLHSKLKEVLPQYPKWGNITIRELLYHTSGVYNYIHAKNFWQNFKKHPYKQWSLAQLANLAYQYPNHFKPGQGYLYTNTDYILLGLIIEKVTHQKAKAVLDHYLLSLDNYNLTNTYYAASGYPNGVLRHLAHGYDDEGTFGYNKDITQYSLSFASTAGAMLTTPNDLTKFLLQLFSGLVLSEQSMHITQSLVSSKAQKITHLSRWLKSHDLYKKSWTEIGQGIGYGLVYFRDTGFSWMHAGGVNGYQSLYSYSPCAGSLVTLIYSSQPKRNFVFINIYQALAKVIKHSKFSQHLIVLYKDHHVLPNYCGIGVLAR